jgi:hypothetical protein
MRSIGWALCTFLVLSAVGCATDWKAKVESTTSWSGSFSGRTVSGSGNQTVDIDDDEIECCTVQKGTDGGFLKVSIVNEGGNFLVGDGESKETSAPYGVVTVCTKK